MISRVATYVDRHRVGVGVVMIILTLVFAVALFNRHRLAVQVGDNEQVSAAFERGYRLRPYDSKVKVAGVPVGVVTDVDRANGGVVVTMAVDRGTREVLGANPSAEIRPLTLLGGKYYVSLAPGADRSTPLAETIPVERTTIPVELDAVLETLQSDARDGAVTAISELDRALANDGTEQVRDLVELAPDALAPAGRVLDAAQGRDADDLTDLVADLEGVTSALTRDDGQPDALLSAAAGTAADLRATADQQRTLLDGLAARLRTTRDGMAALDGSLDRLRAVADDLRPSIVELHQVLIRAEPVLDEALPVVRDLRPTVADLRPVVSDLHPVSTDLTSIVQGVQGPVLDRVNETIAPALNEPYRGDPELFREEIAYMFAGLAGISQYTDVNGPALSFQPGAGIETAGGASLDFLDLLGSATAGEGTR